jgi:hypothetical protein
VKKLRMRAKPEVVFRYAPLSTGFLFAWSSTAVPILVIIG